jgi:two-component system, chemotaxis family, sensor kinase CheA
MAGLMGESNLTVSQRIKNISKECTKLNWSDLQSVARLQTQFDETGGLAKSEGREGVYSICASLAKVMEKFIFDEIKDESEATEVLKSGVKTLKNVIKQKPEEESVQVEAISGLMDNILHLAGEIVEPEGFELSLDGGQEAAAPEFILGLEDMEDILTDFLEATPGTIDELEPMILSYESGDCDPEQINGVFRTFHTLKSESGLLGITKFSEVCHAAETLMECVRDGTRVSPRETVDALLASLDILKEIIRRYNSGDRKIDDVDVSIVLKKILAATPSDVSATDTKSKKKTAEVQPESVEEPGSDLEKEDAEAETSLIADFIAEAGEHIEAIEEGLLLLEANPTDREIINEVFRPFHTIKGVAGFLNLRSIGTLTHELETLLDRGRKGELVITAQIVDLLFDALDVLKSLVSSISAKIQGKDDEAHEVDIVPQLKKIRALGSSNDDGDRSELEEEVEAAEAAAEMATTRLDNVVEAESRSQTKVRTTAVDISSSIKVDMLKLDNLMDMVGELVIAQSQLSQDSTIVSSGSDRLQKNVSQLEKITRDVQEVVMSTRMIPVKGTFQKMARLVRDVAKKAGKQVDFSMHGEDTEMDKNVTELIADPLIHMIRNAVDHGIEPPDERVKAGKDPHGSVSLSAFHKGGNVVVQIIDDGKGLNKKKILEKAIQQGIVKEGENLSEQELNGLIFRPGFSTADKVTDVSGRGVGMDVVRKNIENLRGKVEITSEEGKGSVFTISLPLTLAIIDGMVITVGGQRYIIPMLSILESLRPLKEECKTVIQQGEMIEVRGELLPLIRLYEVLEVTPESMEPWESMVVVVENEGSRCCLLIDDLLGQQQIVIKSLGESFTDVRGISGGTILGDGRVGLIIDIGGIMKYMQMRSK